MAESYTETETKYILVLDEDEKIYLQNLLQNSIYEPDNEPADHRVMRESIFTVLRASRGFEK